MPKAQTPAPPRRPRTPLMEIDPAGLDDEALKEGLANAVFAQANLANLRGYRTMVERVVFRGCRMTGIQFAESTLRDVLVEDCRVDLASMRFSRLERVVFRRCLLQDLELNEAQLTSVVFEECDLSGADFAFARFARSEIRGCTLDRVTSVERLRGVAMPWPDIVGFAGSLAAAIGIAVIDAEDDEQ